MSEHVLRTETRMLPVKLTEGEILERSRRAAEELGQAEREQADFEADKKARKQAIAELEESARLLLQMAFLPRGKRKRANEADPEDAQA